MAKKHSHVPETRDVKPNREQRRHPEKLEAPENEALSRDERPPPDQAEVGRDRKKTTAENWNQ